MTILTMKWMQKLNQSRNQHSHSHTRRWLGLGALLCLLLFSGCMTTRGVMYLHPQSSRKFLEKESRPSNMTAKKALVEKGVEKARELLRVIPDGERRLGGFCSDNDIRNKLYDIMGYIDDCNTRLQKFQNKSNTFGWVFWSLLGTTAVTGLAGVIGAAASPDGNTRANVMLAFGIPMLLASLTNAIGPFSRIQDRNKAKGMKLDNYMWTMRQRVSVEVCTAPNRATAYHRLKQVEQRIKLLCTSKKPDDGAFVLDQ